LQSPITIVHVPTLLTGWREFAVVSLGNESLSYVALWLVEGPNKASSFELVKGLPV